MQFSVQSRFPDFREGLINLANFRDMNEQQFIPRSSKCVSELFNRYGLSFDNICSIFSLSTVQSTGHR